MLVSSSIILPGLTLNPFLGCETAVLSQQAAVFTFPAVSFSGLAFRLEFWCIEASSSFSGLLLLLQNFWT